VQAGIIRSNAPVFVTFEVSRVWKGPKDPTVVAETVLSEASCGYAFTQGAEYIVYAHGHEALPQVSLCSRTRLIAQAGEDLKDLGDGERPELNVGLGGTWAPDCAIGPTPKDGLLRLLTEGEYPDPNCRSGHIILELKRDASTGKLSGRIRMIAEEYRDVQIEAGSSDGVEFTFRTQVEIDRNTVTSYWSGRLGGVDTLRAGIGPTPGIRRSDAELPLMFRRVKNGPR
jgi:hypothetical protein